MSETVSADHRVGCDYNDRYGPRERYKDECRRGFLAGFERGYREGRYR